MGFLSSMYNMPKPRGFNMQPRYYDKKKEDRERRRAIILQQVKLEKGEEIPKGEFVSDIHRKFEQNKLYSRKSHHEGLKALLMLAFLLFLGVFLIMQL